jgi:TonB-linked SusC/RagA family outer membrane protein
MQFSFAQQKTVTGTVTSDGANLPNATVSISGTQEGTLTDENGKFSIKAAQGDVLVFSFLGKDSKSVTVGAGNVVNVVLSTSNTVIQDVIVQGYRTVTKKTSNVADATVGSKTIENRPNANAMNTLQGQLAGVNITASTGQPGAKSSVVIRGLATINGSSDPLYVIDGFPTTADNFRTINSNDIETVTVLKDAIAISQYGNRGSNGVIVVKTKKAKFGKDSTTFRYSSQYGIANLQEPKYNYANAQQLLKLEQTLGVGIGAGLTDAEINAYTTNTDWVDYFFRPATTLSHNLSIENSSKKVTSFTSLGYMNQDGVLETTGMQRFNLRNNINGKSENDKFKYQINTAFGYSKNNEATTLGEGAINRNYVLGAYLSAPHVSVNEYQGSQSALDYYNNTPGLLATPIMLIDKLNTYRNLTDEARIDVATDFAYSLNSNFTVRTKINGTFLNNRFFQSEFPNSFNALLFSSTPGVSSLDGGNFNGFEDINNRREFYYNNLFQLEYNKKINEHTFYAAANFEYNHSRLHTNNFRQRGLNALTFVPNTGAGYVADVGTNDFYVPQISASQLRSDLVSYFGIFDYDFKEKYGLSANVRRDGTSRFINDFAWGTFYSIGGRWNIDEESFMDKFENIDILKLRASYGTSGNERIVGGTAFAGIVNPTFSNNFSLTNNTYNGQQGLAYGLGFPEATWEVTTNSNIGFDLEMYKSKLRLNLDFYNRFTEDIFLDAPIQSAVGASTLRKNSDADITNRGLELNVAYDLINNPEKDIRLTLRANGSYNKNTVGGIATNDGKIIDTNSAGYSLITQNGGTIYEPFVYPYLGVNPANGNLLFEDINGNPTENPIAFDRRASGKNFIPVYQGGFGFDFDYKGFFASTTFTFVYDVWRFDTDEENLYDVGNIGQFNVAPEMLNAWTPTNTGSNLPSLSATNLAAQGNSDRFLRDASYVRLRNAQIGYRLPKKHLKKLFISDLAFTIQGENLVTFTKWAGFDAESSRTADFYQYPTPRIYTFGIDIKF